MRTTKKALHRHAVIGYLTWHGGWVYPLDMLRTMAISSGSLYPILDDLVAEGLVERSATVLPSRVCYRWVGRWGRR